MNQPLAERIRPQQLSDYISQLHLVGTEGSLTQQIAKGLIPSLILWGPPGTGKTTLAQIMAQESKRPFYQLSAIHSGVKDIREVIEKAKQSSGLFTAKNPILFIDEIHRFSKSQQDSLLAAVEKGWVTLIGATTENPSFEVIPALLSRCQVYVLNAFTKDDLEALLHRAMKTDVQLQNKDIQLKENELEEFNNKLSNQSEYNQRRLTNLGTFRAYVNFYLRQHEGIAQDQTLIVRQLQPTSMGLPIEIYAFISTTVWIDYENIQSDIFDHLISILPEFGLRIYQSASQIDMQILATK